MMITCAYCQGTGKKYGRGTETVCPVCDGSGQVNVPTNHIECGYCKGTGHKYGRGTETICPVCNGIGITKIVNYDT